ncbi:MAG: FAD-dependent oxidoreductase [Pseudomonadota bacterium]
MDRNHCEILIIGAGMAGLACATRLANAGRQVRVLDKGRGPGGRMAARRIEIAGGTVSFDHGAQYFTARDPAFCAAVEAWEALGVVARWPAAGDDAWVGTPGMNGPIRSMAENLDLRWSARADTIANDGASWRVSAGDTTFTADTVLVAVPAEQAHDLLQLPVPDLAAVAAGVQSEPCWAVMVGFSEPLSLEVDALRDPCAAISWAARNSAKPGRMGTECWVLHASPTRSRELLDLPKEEVAALMLSDFLAQTGARPADPVHLVAHRWLYAMPGSVPGEPARFDKAYGIGIAGDYLHSPRVEGAFLSGCALAEKVLVQG